MTDDSIVTSLDNHISSPEDDFPGLTYIRGRLSKVTFNLSGHFVEQLVEHEDGLSVSVKVSIHGINTHDGKPPKVSVTSLFTHMQGY